MSEYCLKITKSSNYETYFITTENMGILKNESSISNTAVMRIGDLHPDIELLFLRLK
jgi:hypothetical protein